MNESNADNQLGKSRSFLLISHLVAPPHTYVCTHCLNVWSIPIKEQRGGGGGGGGINSPKPNLHKDSPGSAGPGNPGGICMHNVLIKKSPSPYVFDCVVLGYW